MTSTAVHSKVVILLSLIPCFLLFTLRRFLIGPVECCGIWGPFGTCFHLAEEVRAGCFALLVI